MPEGNNKDMALRVTCTIFDILLLIISLFDKVWVNHGDTQVRREGLIGFRSWGKKNKTSHQTTRSSTRKIIPSSTVDRINENKA